ncbi:MAG TPA: CopD family protein [Roseiflexaceae bacterium]|nr:CopD family protein [Roseiflexaceae bacterium]
MKRRFVLPALLLAWLWVGQAAAHANLVASNPRAGASLAAAPAEIVLEFSEELDPAFSRIELYNSRHRLIDTGEAIFDPAEPLVLRLTLGELPRDSYTAVWRARSAVDGHITEGNIPFGIGVAAPVGALAPPPGSPDPATVLPTPFEAAIRWLTYLLAALAFGSLPFVLLVWRPALRTVTAAGSAAASFAPIPHLLRRLLLAGGVLFLAANSLLFWQQAAAAADLPLVAAFGTPLLHMLGGRSGLIWLVRMACTLAILALAWRMSATDEGTTSAWWLMLGLGGVVLLTFSLSGHGAAEAEAALPAVVADWLHMAAMVAWLGGLPPLLATIQLARRTPHGLPLLQALIPRFSALALLCVAILSLSGIYAAFIHIGRPELLVSTSYGWVLIAKIGLFGLLIMLGALNLLLFSPRLRSAGLQAAAFFKHTIRAELLVGAILLLAVGVMMSIAPSRSAWEAHERLGLVESAAVGDVELTLWVAPGRIGDNEFAIDIADRRPAAADTPAQVLLNFTMPAMDMGTLQVATQPAEAGRHAVRGNYAAMGGRWQIEVVVRRAGFDDVRHTFELDIVQSALLP